MIVCFCTDTEFNLEALTLFGVSAKLGPSPIGRFGTGLKYALATLARAGARVKLKINDEWFKLSNTTKSLRDKHYEQLELLSIPHTEYALPLPFSTDLGAHWELWMAYRELWSNTKDEGGQVGLYESWEEFSNGLLVDSRTIIMVELEDFTQIAQDHGKYVLESAPLWTRDGVEFHTNGGLFLAMGEIRVANELDGRGPDDAQFSYNLTGDWELTEDRTLVSEYQAKAAIAKAWLQCDDQTIVSSLYEREDSWEFCQLDLDRSVDQISRVMLEKALARIKAKQALPYGLKQTLKRLQPKAVATAERQPVPNTIDEILAQAPVAPAELEDRPEMYEIRNWMIEAEDQIRELRAQLVYWKEAALKLGGKSEGESTGVADDNIPF